MDDMPTDTSWIDGDGRHAPRSAAPITYPGGKAKMVKKLLPLLPSAKCYVEPYAGAASMLFARPPQGVEIINDIDGDIVNLFRVLQDEEQFSRLRRLLLYTPYSRSESERARDIIRSDCRDPVWRAWAYFVAYNQSIGGLGRRTWGMVLTETARGMASTTSRWLRRLSMLSYWHRRLMRVQIENRDALECIAAYDSEDTVFYIDPPYIPETRRSTDIYKHEADLDHHRALIDLLLHIKGKALVSGYDHPLYRALDEAGWARYTFKVVCHMVPMTRFTKQRGIGTRYAFHPRTEIAWVKDDGAGRQLSIW